jgi:uncharacterized protein (TIGR02118 family)
VVKLVLLFRRRQDLPHAEFLRYWHEEHVPLVTRVPGIQRYVISPVYEQPDGAGPAAPDGMAELWFDDEQALESALSSEQTRATAVDARNFIERGSIVRVFCREQEIDVAPAV